MIRHPFEQFVAFADSTTKNIRRPITEQEFLSWKEQFSFDALHGLRYGQSFCKHFGIEDNLLLYASVFRTIETCDNYIRKHYIARS